MTEPIEKQSSDTDVLLLENQLCFALYTASRAMTKTYKEKLTGIGLTYPQYLVMITLWEENGLTISEIGDRLALDSGTITPLIQRLEKVQFVRRERSKKDERSVNVWTTETGDSLKGQVLDTRLHVAKRLGMSEEDIRQLRADLMDMVDRLDAALEDSPA